MAESCHCPSMLLQRYVELCGYMLAGLLTRRCMTPRYALFSKASWMLMYTVSSEYAQPQTEKVFGTAAKSISSTGYSERTTMGWKRKFERSANDSEEAG